jgi:hypothetical protein
MMITRSAYFSDKCPEISASSREARSESGLTMYLVPIAASGHLERWVFDDAAQRGGRRYQLLVQGCTVLG